MNDLYHKFSHCVFLLVPLYSGRKLRSLPVANISVELGFKNQFNSTEILYTLKM